MKKKATINGHVYRLAFDFSVVLTYEDTFDTTFDITTLTRLSNQMRLVYAILKANNPDFDLPFDLFVKTINVRELTAITNDIVPLMTAFYNVPTIAEQHVPEQDTTDEDPDASPNA